MKLVAIGNTIMSLMECNPFGALSLAALKDILGFLKI